MNSETVIGIEQETFAEPLTLQTPGALLKQGRLAARLTPHDVANRLYLTVQIIELIERDDFERGPNPVFIRGYLRAYAKLVSLPENDIIRAFNKLGIDKNSAHLPSEFYERQVSSKDKSVRWFTYLVVAALIALVFIWWRNHNQTSITEQPAIIASTAEVDIPIIEKTEEVVETNNNVFSETNTQTTFTEVANDND